MNNTERKVTVMPATLDRFTAMPINGPKKRRVAAYARVSTDEEEQLNSYEAQVNYYTQYIGSREDWEFAGIYSDEGITGTSTKRRDGFKKMIQDALDGSIDLIITKSISRFARNTVDSLITVRALKEKGVEVFFEKENIFTLDSKGELLITIMSSLAQEESRSISENVTWGMRKRFADGKVSMPYKVFLGYRKGANGQPEIVPEEAELVVYIYDLFLEGKSPSFIARQLTAEGIMTLSGKARWTPKRIENVLTNEKYKGDVLLQKRFTVDFLTKKTKVNEGEVPQYYVEGSHPAIIPPEKFDAVQVEMQRRKANPHRFYTPHCFSGYIFCEDCGGLYGSKTWHSTDRYKKVVWQCNAKYRHEKLCQTPLVHTEEMQAAFVQAINRVVGSKAEIIDLCEKALNRQEELDGLSKQISKLQAELGVVSELMQRPAADQEEYITRCVEIRQQFDEATAQKTQMTAKRSKIMTYLQTLRKADLITEFDDALWYGTVDRVWVSAKGCIRFVFKDGQEVEIR